MAPPTAPTPAPPREGDIADDIRRRSPPRASELRIGAVAEPQHGVVTLAQLAEIGLGERGAQHRAANGRLVRASRGVYAVGQPGDRGRWLAALLGCRREQAVLSHRSAAELWGLLPTAPGPIHVTSPGSRWRGPAGVIAHRASLAESDTAIHHGIRCTTVARTLVDVAALLDQAKLTRAIHRADELRVFDLGAIDRQLARMRGKRGTAALRRALEELDVRGVPANDAERNFKALIARAKLPEPEVNVWLALPSGGGYRPDFLWRDRGLIAELDGRTFHARLRAFEHDRIRDRRLLDAGYATARFAAREVTRSPDQVAAELRRLLAGRRPDPAPGARAPAKRT